MSQLQKSNLGSLSQEEEEAYLNAEKGMAFLDRLFEDAMTLPLENACTIINNDNANDCNNKNNNNNDSDNNNNNNGKKFEFVLPKEKPIVRKKALTTNSAVKVDNAMKVLINLRKMSISKPSPHQSGKIIVSLATSLKTLSTCQRLLMEHQTKLRGMLQDRIQYKCSGSSAK